MRVGLRGVLIVLGVLHGLLAASPASAQPGGTRRLALDTVIGVQDIFAETRDWPTQIVADTFVSYAVRPGLQVSARPVLWRVGGEWEGLLDQLSVQYEFTRGSNWRLEAGRFPSPIGFGMTENRASINAGVLWCHRPYYMPLPPLADDQPRVSLVSAIYPTGVQVATSGPRWDARAAVVDTAPVRFWSGDGPHRSVNAIVGGGLSPAPGLRLGLASAWGEIRGEAGDQATPYRMINAEAEYVFGYTRLGGEWTHDRFDVGGRSVSASGVTAQVRQTLSPRVFAHARATLAWSERVDGSATLTRERFGSLDTTIGYHLDPEVTVRAGYNLVRGFTSDAVDHQVAVSLMWVRRWW